ncbi:plasmid stabilization protein (plasmid) [Azospirillum baldaniorum]|uniref:Plasmid stabilization system n=3 Tax=Azospirillum TaxID=191 RepID=A0A9P1JYY9_9PROT|nr:MULTISPECIES: type II toxin-antitoxin system RelE/ParE family toxin [Azospirillum]TWA76289.1 mRNA interferase RelE/StbE [Azospirillum brasilense]AWJ92946.1 plasmid stabilization protein [Azospirillum baldaniorum]NUB09688.1 type II toxin-antitoxin system RelE/ParE family toxin [Azospirillum baldaniorum]QCO06470.1 type II toxin-antitoxin system RelE/ParE family toxin [Azospirillum argentinense]TWA61819.1 mRNA interferase RelE/StbE [Azospirillum baldaniorum]
MHTIRYTAAALKTLRRMPRNTAELIRLKLQEVAADPANARNVKKLKGRDGYRLRVGDWRIVYDLESGVLVLIVIEIGPRGGIYD